MRANIGASEAFRKNQQCFSAKLFAEQKKGPPNGGPFKYWCWLQDLNPPPPDYKSGALPDELSQRNLEERDYTLFDSLEGRSVGFFCGSGIVRFGIVVIGSGCRHRRQFWAGR